jgi:hypothetical protein
MFSRFYREECWIDCADVEATSASNGEGVHVEPPGLYRLG